MTNTALRAENSNSRTITFKSKEHEKFYMEYLEKCRYQDVYHQALVYCLGIDRDTRENVNKIYNFKTGCVKTESLQEGWQTSGSLRIVRMAFNLYCNGTPSVGDYEAEEDQLKECQYYTVEDLFCCGYARYFWEAIKIRYPEYCFYKDWEDMYAENQITGYFKDIQWFRRILEKHKELDVLEVSDAYANKGTSKYFRVYVEVEEKSKSEESICVK